MGVQFTLFSTFAFNMVKSFFFTKIQIFGQYKIKIQNFDF